MKKILALAVFCAAISGCNSQPKQENGAADTAALQHESTDLAAGPAWKGTISNGMKGDAISFDIKGQKLENLTFTGYWRCSGRLEQTTLGPDDGFAIKNGAVDGVITEPQSGFRFEVHGTIRGNKAEGTIRFSYVAAGCDTYSLKWTATKK